jgi:hypothetical protein
MDGRADLMLARQPDTGGRDLPSAREAFLAVRSLETSAL